MTGTPARLSAVCQPDSLHRCRRGQVQVSCQQTGKNGSLMDGWIIVVDDLAQILPSIAVLDDIRAEGFKCRAPVSVFGQYSLAQSAIPAVFDLIDDGPDGFAACFVDIGICQ